MKKWGTVVLIVVICIVLAVTGFSLYLHSQIKDITIKNKDLESENAKLVANNDQLKEDKSNAESLADTLEDSISILEKKNEQLNNEAEGYRNDINNLNSNISSLEETIKELENKEAEVIYVQPPDASLEPSFSYQTLYPDLYVETVLEYSDPSEKTVYITFDDGPSARTDEILKILEEKGIKATFFVVPNKSAECTSRLKAMVEAGHTIGIHTSSHVYNTIYASVDNYLDDFYKAWSIVYNATGMKCDIFRFPGGSINSYNRAIYQQLIAEMARRGFIYYDWNTSGDDSAGQKTAEGIFNMTVKTAGGQKKVILLLHDNSTKVATVEALPMIIDHFKNKGYSFGALSQNIKPVTYSYK